jgi:hypothetical protein
MWVGEVLTQMGEVLMQMGEVDVGGCGLWQGGVNVGRRVGFET